MPPDAVSYGLCGWCGAFVEITKDSGRIGHLAVCDECVRDHDHITRSERVDDVPPPRNRVERYYRGKRP